MRTLTAFALLGVATLLAPVAQAEFGAYGPDGWPIAADGTSTNPYPGLSADQLAQALADGDPLNQVGGTTVYPYWPVLTAEVMRLAQDHPDLVRLTTAGKSTLGLDLYMLEICNFAAVANVQPLSMGDACPAADGTLRETVWVDGGHHSNEYSGVYFALAWAQFLVEQYGQNDTATWIVDNRHTWIMPMVNPDGSNAFGRLNAHGVNVNRNYPVIWDGEGHDELMNNRGPSPASEIETQINIEWFNKTRADYSASIHCCGNLWLYPYGQEGVDPIDQPMLQGVCDEAFAEVRADCGPIWSTIYPASGSSVDTAYEYTGMVAFGYEMSGRGAVAIWGQPVTFETVQTQEVESWQGLEHAFLNVHRYGALPVVTDVQADGAHLKVTVRNDGLGNLTHATVAGSYMPNVHLLDGISGTSLPPLEPGQSATVTVERDASRLQGGERYVVAVHYAKRLIATSNEGLVTVPVAYADQGAPEAPAGGFLVAAHGADEVGSPAAPIGLLAIGLAALAIFARRR